MKHFVSKPETPVMSAKPRHELPMIIHPAKLSPTLKRKRPMCLKDEERESKSLRDLSMPSPTPVSPSLLKLVSSHELQTS